MIQWVRAATPPPGPYVPKFIYSRIALQSMVITKQTQIGGEGEDYHWVLYPDFNLMVPLTVPEHNDSSVFHVYHLIHRSLMLFLYVLPQDIPSEHRPVSWSILSTFTYLFQYTDPPTALGVWIALEQCTSENGALSFLPGSHLSTKITKRFVRLPNGGTGFEYLSADAEHGDPTQSSGDYKLETCSPGTSNSFHWVVFPHFS